MEKDAKQNQLMENVGNIADAVKKAAQDKAEAAKQAADQNGDGKFDLQDVKALADDAKDKAAEAVQDLKNTAINLLNERELKNLRPIFSVSLTDPDFSTKKIVNISERSKRYAEKEVTKGSIGYLSEYKDVEVVNIFEDSVDAFGLSFYPNSDYGVYYADPIDKNKYIAVERYFSYLANARVSELQRMAKDLGAKHFKIIYREVHKEKIDKNDHVKLKLIKKKDASANQREFEHKYQDGQIAAELTFLGQDPVRPNLAYLKNEPDLNELIEMRMGEGNKVTHKNISVKFIDTCGIKKTDAAKIDTVLKGLKLDAGLSFESEVNNESMRYFEYEIDF